MESTWIRPTPNLEASALLITFKVLEFLAIGPVRIRLHGIDAPKMGQYCVGCWGGTWQCD